MKFIQIFHKYTPYIEFFEKKYNVDETNPDFKTLRRLLIQDGFYAPHILKPIFEEDDDAFYTLWDYDRLQLAWAKENNVDSTDLKEILGLQIQKFNPEVIYNMSPQKIDFNFLQNFGKKLLCWNADPYSINDESLLKYDALLTSSVNKSKQANNVFLHYPSSDPLMDEVLDPREEIDVFFYGQFDGAPFQLRREYIRELVDFFTKKNISFDFAVMYNESERIKINIPFIRRFNFAKEKVPPKNLSRRFTPPVFGKDIYEKISKSKIIFNISATHENFGEYKFNMRIFETLGVGGFLLSDEGNYPPHLEAGNHFVTYSSIEDLKEKIIIYLRDDIEREKIRKKGKNVVHQNYSKTKQWENFLSIVKSIDS
ncbi:MAG TPA: hypothetical protein DIS75_10555 [Chryseobacterium sp.]|jgi:hypothetical protein|nr:hypothetical protein [Chryseobacterium sp.]